MVLPIVQYGDPVLRQKGARVEAITPEVRTFIADMLETMRAARGVGLAAQQVGRPLRIAVVDIRGIIDRPSTLHIDNQPTAPEEFMPVVLINPEIKPVGEPVTGPEGCLSFPELYADIARPGGVEVTALNLNGESFSFRGGGLLARAVQHEVDHLNGILFIDRMETAKRRELRPELDELQAATRAALARKH